MVAVGVVHIGTVLGPRLGCRAFPPFGYGVDLAALCLTEDPEVVDRGAAGEVVLLGGRPKCPSRLDD